ncbi:MAG: TldD/PmbA family protein [Proteobacteria bacterium]|nr:TldD/PmbA family protein [Pseudomonadota bacterium]
MNQELKDLCNWAIDTAKKYGATDCKASVSKRRFVKIDYLNRKPEVIKEATTQNLSVDIYINQKYSSQSTPDLRKASLESFLKRAIENTKYIDDDPYRTLPDAKYYDLSLKKDLKLADTNHGSFSATQRHEIAKQLEDACIKQGGDKVVSVEAGCYDHHYEKVMLNSKGFSGGVEDTQFWAGAQLTAQDEGDRRPTGSYWVGARMKNDLPDFSDVGIMAANNTLELLGGKKIKTEKLPIIIQNRNVGRILRGLIQGMNGRAIQQQSSFLIDKKGEKIGSDLLTLNDNPFIEKGLGSRLYDSDGLPAKARQHMKNGVLNDYYTNWYYSRKLGVEPTAGYTSNLSIPEGEKSVQELMKDLKRGIVINGFIGGNSNTATGDFSIGIIGHLFDNGELIQPIAEMNMADNHLEFWKKLVATGNDAWKYGSWNLPSLVFEDIVVSGL